MTTTPAPRLDEPAPLALANTLWIDRHGIHDMFADDADTHTWVRAIGDHLELTPELVGAGLSASAVTHLIDLRNAVRRLAADRTQDPRNLGQSPVLDTAEAISIVNAASATSWVWPELRLAGKTLARRDAWTGDSFGEALITVIARQTVDLVISPQWQQLRPCTAPSCAYYFIKEHFRREWCSALCGNRARVARYSQRHRSQSK